MNSSHLSPELREEHGRRSLAPRKGDRVKVMRGSFKGSTGKVAKCLPSEGKSEIEGVERERVDGSKVRVPIANSNLMIVELFHDSRRALFKGEKPKKAKKPKSKKAKKASKKSKKSKTKKSKAKKPKKKSKKSKTKKSKAKSKKASKKTKAKKASKKSKAKKASKKTKAKKGSKKAKPEKISKTEKKKSKEVKK